MCMVSFVGIQGTKTIPERYPWVIPPLAPWVQPLAPITPSPSQADFDALRREVEALRALLVAAKEYDAATGQPDCQQDEKVALIRRLAELVDVDLGDVLD